jgi:hypothetical protein
MIAKWQLLLRKESGDVVIQNFQTRREAEEEIENRRSLTVHLGTNPKEIYHVKRAGRKRYTYRSL